MITIPEYAVNFGFDNGPGGPHTSRTIMLAELRLLFAAYLPSTPYQQYAAGIIDQNILLKRTDATRRESLRRLRELYALSPTVIVFRALRDLWEANPAEQPLLAILAALARDPLLRASAKPIYETPPGGPVTASMISAAVDAQLAGRLNAMTLANIGRHAASSWAQSGHLSGRTNKTRAAALCGPASTAYALLLGYLCGARGEALFKTFWSSLTDAANARLHEHAIAAARLGWLEYRSAGAVTDVGFSYLLRDGKA